MWWSRLAFCLMLMALGPAGCGFTPMYARSTGGAPSQDGSDLAAIRIMGIDDREGVVLREHLIHALNPRGEPSSPLYFLQINLKTDLQGQAQSIDGNATIGRMNVRAGYTLTDAQTGKVLYASTTQAYGSFRLSGPRYGSVAAERAAEETGIISVSEDIRAALAAWFANRRANR